MGDSAHLGVVSRQTHWKDSNLTLPPPHPEFWVTGIHGAAGSPKGLSINDPKVGVILCTWAGMDTG